MEELKELVSELEHAPTATGWSRWFCTARLRRAATSINTTFSDLNVLCVLKTDHASARTGATAEPILKLVARSTSHPSPTADDARRKYTTRPAVFHIEFRRYRKDRRPRAVRAGCDRGREDRRRVITGSQMEHELRVETVSPAAAGSAQVLSDPPAALLKALPGFGFDVLRTGPSCTTGIRNRKSKTQPARGGASVGRGASDGRHAVWKASAGSSRGQAGA